ncbi:hypothetical protein Tco_0294037 [Tanacetum coccineum]
MGDANPICTLGDYFKPSHEGYRNTIQLPIGNNVVPLQSDTIRLVQNGCSFHRLWSEDPNQHLKDFLKLVDSLNLDGENRERTRLLAPMTLSIAWKIPNKPLLNMHPHVPTKREVDDGDIMFIEIIRKNDDSREEGPKDEGSTMIEGLEVEYFDTFLTKSELAYHSSIIDPRLSQVVLGRPFVKISNMIHDPPEGVVRFTNRTDEVAYKMPYRIEQYNSLSDLKKEHTKSVYLRNDEDKKRGVEYVMSKILGFYKECLELGPEYVTGMDDEGEVT